MDGTWRRWWWRLLVVVVVVVVEMNGVEGGDESRVRLVDNGYEGVVVGVSQAVKEEDGPALVEALKVMLQESSRRLFRATGRRAYFRDVSILIPRHWTSVNITHQAASESFQTSDIQVEQANPAYQNQPYTLQSGGCGDPGQHIHLTPTYLLDDTEASMFGPRGKVFLLEWAKYRWGVFDELGYPGDPAFPLFYTGEGGRVIPTHCANEPISGWQVDKRSRDACGVTRFGTPDEHCRFVPHPNQWMTSSLLSYPLLKSDQLVYFCGDVGKTHNVDAPTKQNLFCNKRAAWEVIAEHEDFVNGNNPKTETVESVSFRIVQQADAHFALVLDYSVSMDDHNRIHKLRRTARRWLLHEVAEGSHVAVIKFSQTATLVRPMTQITDEASRKVLADAIDTNLEYWTSIGAGLRAASRILLAGKINPVILLLTDGEENKEPFIDDVLSDVAKSGARVITVAFGAKADPKLEKVAHFTRGKTFTVNDVDGGQMLQDAFHGALTYQPPPSPALLTVLIHEKEYRGGGTEASGSFPVDSTLGANLTLRLETVVSTNPSLTNPQLTSDPQLIGPDGRIYKNANFDVDSSTWTLIVILAKEGEWQWRVGLSGQRDSFVRARVTSQPRNPYIQPITTRAWVSTGGRQVNAGVDTVKIFAEVKQGTNPVVYADVRAVVTPPNESDQEQVYVLLDNGQGADRLAGDGIYSRYMTKYPSTGRYSVKAQVTSGGQALINKGFLTSPQRRRRRQVEEEEEDKEEQEMDEEYVRHLLDGPDICCGSVVPLPPDAPPTGPFSRSYSGGSIKVDSVPPSDFLAPARVRDLSVDLVGVGLEEDSLPTLAHLTLAFTAPGDDMDAGIASGYHVRMTPNKEDLDEDNFAVNTTSPSSSSSSSNNSSFSNNSSSSNSSSWRVVDLSGHPVEVEGGTLLSLNLSLTLTSPTTFFALRAWDDAGTLSEVSNIAALHLDAYLRPPARSGGMSAWVIVVVVVAVLCLVVVVLMLCLANRRRTSGALKLY